MVRLRVVLPLLLFGCEATVDPVAPVAPVDLVDPMIGTGGAGFGVGSMTPAATVPFGMVKLGPDTASEGGVFEAYHCAGYYADDTYIEGFSHLHMPGVGVADQGTILVMPVLAWEDRFVDSAELRTPFDKATESAHPGRYEVDLDNGIGVRLSATEHAGHHAYHWPSGTTPTLVFDLQHNLDGSNSGGEITVDVAAGRIEGWTLNTGSFSGGDSAYKVYFSAELDAGITQSGVWGDSAPVEGGTAAAGVDLGAWVVLDQADVDVRVGLSVVSLEGARKNLAAELPAQDINDTMADARAAWVPYLDVFTVRPGEADPSTVRFYTAVYHLLQMPTLYADADGSFMGWDDVVYPDPGFRYHSDMSFWDTYRTAHPAYSLFYPEKARDFAQSVVVMAETGGALPRWPIAHADGGSMLGAPADIVLADTWVRGVRDWDMVDAWPILREQSRGMRSYPYNGRPGVGDIDSLGWLPVEEYGASVAWLMEMAWADGALAQLAASLGKTEDAAFYGRRALVYRNVYDPAVGFFHGRRRDGTFLEDFSDTTWLDEYTEGTAWQYLWLAPQDPEGLATLLGGAEAATARLDAMFEATVAEGETPLPSSYYWHGNEPDIHAAWLYALWGDRAGTETWTRWILENSYDETPTGLPGNDDGGTMSAWYIFAAAGFYPVAGFPTYILGIPRFAEMEIQLGDHSLTVVREGDGAHVAAVYVDGLAWPEPTIQHGVLVAAHELRFVTE